MQKLYEVINEQTWYKGDLVGPRGRQCLIAWLGQLYTGHEYARAKGAVKQAIRAVFPDRVFGGVQIAYFNDHPDTTVEDVIRVCKVADV